MTYSEVVHLLSSHMVPADDLNPSIQIPLLEKFINKGLQGMDEPDYQQYRSNTGQEHVQDEAGFEGENHQDYNNQEIDETSNNELDRGEQDFSEF